jgi:hypothetical protein
MKANKALKRLGKIEALMSDVTERYSSSASHIREALQNAKTAVARAKEVVSLHASSGAKVPMTAKDPVARTKETVSLQASSGTSQRAGEFPLGG